MGYGKIIVKGLYSANSDYSEPQVTTSGAPYTPTVTEYQHQVVTARTTATIIDVGDNTTGTFLQWSNVSSILIKNLDAANYVEVLWFNKLSVIPNPGGGGFVIANSSPGSRITDATGGGAFSGALQYNTLIISDPEDSANTKEVVLHSKTSNDVIEISSLITANAADTSMVLTVATSNRQKLPAGGWLVVPGNVATLNTTLTRGEIRLIANSGNCKVEILTFGS